MEARLGKSVGGESAWERRSGTQVPPEAGACYELGLLFASALLAHERGWANADPAESDEFSVAVTTGMRRGELLALRWEDVDFETVTSWPRNTAEHKTKSRRNRVLALCREVAKLLHALPRKGGLVFGTEDGPMRGDTVTKGLRKVVEGAGIKYCTLHDLRRTFVSHLANAGVNAALVQQLAGHSAIATTVKYYTGVMPEALRAAQARLPFQKVIGGVSDMYHVPDEAAGVGKDGRIIKLASARA